MMRQQDFAVQNPISNRTKRVQKIVENPQESCPIPFIYLLLEGSTIFTLIKPLWKRDSRTGRVLPSARWDR